MDVETTADLREWVKVVEDVGKSCSHHGQHSNIVHQIISFALPSSDNASIVKSKDDVIEITGKLTSISSINSVLSFQIRSMFAQGLSIFIEKLINYEDVDSLGRILMWAWSVYEKEFWQIISFQYLYQSILINEEYVKKEANMKFHNTNEKRHMCCSRPSVITTATVAILSSLSFSHRTSYSLMVINSLRNLFNIYLEGQTQSVRPSCLFSFDIFITLYQACIPHSKSHSISMFAEILATIAQYGNKDDNIKVSLHECFVSMLEALAANSCPNDILRALSSHWAPVFTTASLPHRTRIMTVLLNHQFLESPVLSEFERIESSCFNPTALSILQQLLGIILEQTTLFCTHHEIDPGESNEWSIDALLAPTLASTILESKSKDMDMNEKLSYILKCIEVCCLFDSIPKIHSEEGVFNCPIHEKNRLDSTLFTRQGVLLSIQHDQDDIDEEESSSEIIIDSMEANNGINKAFNWQEMCSSEESLWRWVCRPSEVHATLSDAKSFGNETSLDDLLQVVIERLLVSKYLIHRLVHCWSAMQNGEKELRSCAETIFVGMEQIIAQVTFCKNLISLGKAMAILQEQRGKQVSLPSKQNRTFLSTATSIRLFNVLQSHTNAICATIPLPLWLESITFALAEDPCVIYSGTMFLLLEAFALVSNLIDPMDAIQESLEGRIIEIIWSHLPLWWQCLESLRKDKHYFKRLKFLSVYSAAALGSDEVYQMDTGIMDPIEKSVVHGEMVKHADYRCFVSTVLSCLAMASRRFPSASNDFVSIVAQEHQQRNKDTADQNPPLQSDIPGEIQASIQPTKLLLDIIVSHRNNNGPSPELILPTPVEEDKYVDSIIAALKTSSPTSLSKNDADATGNVTVLGCLYSFMDVAQDGLILSCLLHLMQHLTHTQASGVYCAIDTGLYKKSLWQVQRQLITDYAGIETLIQCMYVYQYQYYQATDIRSVEFSWLALLYRCSWGFVTDCIRNRFNDDKFPNSAETEHVAHTSSAVSSISVLEESFSRHVSNNGLLLFHSGYLLRVWWEQWFEQETVSDLNGEVGLHLLLCNLTKVYELMGQKVDANLSQEPHSEEDDAAEDIHIHGELFHSNRKNIQSLDASLSRKRQYEEDDVSAEDVETVDVLSAKRSRSLLFIQDPHQPRIIPNLPEFQTSLWFANLYDTSISDAVAMESLDHCLDMILRLFPSLRLLSSPRSASEENSSVTTQHLCPAAWYILHLQLWHTLQAWFMTHFPPPARHIVHLAQWTQQWMEDRLLARLETLQTLLVQISEVTDGVDGGDGDSVEGEQVVLELFLLATMLQAAQRFFGILLTVLKTTQHLAYKLCTQVQEECGQLVDHIVTLCRPYVVSSSGSWDTAEEEKDEEDWSDDKITAWIMKARLLCDALLHSCAGEKWSVLVHETLVLPRDRDTIPSLDDTVVTHQSEESFLSRWLQIMKKRVLQPWIQTNVASFLRSYES